MPSWPSSLISLLAAGDVQNGVAGGGAALTANIGQFKFRRNRLSASAVAVACAASLAEHISLPLIDVKVINKVSQNLHAEMALRLVGKLSGLADLLKAHRGVEELPRRGRSEERRICLTGWIGFSRRDLVTPSAIVQLLPMRRARRWGPAYRILSVERSGWLARALRQHARSRTGACQTEA